MIIRTGKEPLVFSIQPIALWVLISALAAIALAFFLLGWGLGQLSTRKVDLQTLSTNQSQLS